MEFLQFLKDVSVIIASCVAIYGISSWRREYRGKKHAELAEEALCLFYEGRDAIRQIRSPFGDLEEGKTRKPSKNESPQEKAAYDQAYVLIERYNCHLALFNRLHSIRYRFMAQFGKESAEPFEKFRNILTELTLSAWELARLRTRRNEGLRTEEEQENYLSRIDQVENVFWEGLPEKDPIVPRVEGCIKEIEVICRPILDDRKTTIMIRAQTIFKRLKDIVNKRRHKDRS